ncbi:alpha/beta hydrolase [Streptomyces sp. SBT349]|uniref:alpha/beta hydrolase n=1 Tax=Streptomyces sp. SBT349 TaxID=1580539 RepID=UPI00066ABCA4|nr:alpha/beta hydrolase [Streptomyces sp. SBT349]
MSPVSRRALIGTFGTFGTAAASAAASPSASAATPSAAAARPVPARLPSRPVGPVNAEVAAAHGIDYKALPQEVVGVDCEELMTVRTEEDTRTLRAALVAEVWKSADGLLPSALPEVERGVDAPELPAFAGVRRVDRLSVRMPFDLSSVVFLLLPRHSEHGRFAFYHNGHGEEPGTMTRTAQALLDAGYAVLLFAMPFYHWNPRELRDPLDPTRTVTVESHNDLGPWETPEFSTLRFFLEPPAVAMNHVLREYRPPSVQMIGLSGGGWAATVYPALDPRVTRSYPAAGSLPFFLRSAPPKPSPTTGDWEQRRDRHPAFYGISDFMDLYALAAVGAHRRQMQILNRFDECCFNAVGHRGYEPVVRHRVEVIGNGHWELLEDATHGDHTISPFALSVVLWDLDVACGDLP